MAEDFPAISIDIEESPKKFITLAGFYREWAGNDGDRSETSQVERIKTFSNQIEAASERKRNIIVLGDMNLCTNIWDDKDFKYKNIAEPLRSTIDNCGLKIATLNTLASGKKP